jgi:23S rRNA (pseudouridine1915-N3)-methyltransferase
MKIELICVGRGSGGWLAEGVKAYTGRLQHYTDFAIREVVLPSRMTSSSARQQVDAEGKLILKSIANMDYVVLLDACGRQLGSPELAHYVQQQMNRSTRKLAFVVGGAYGFSQEVYCKSHDKLALSKMTMPHQLVRLFFTEQLYRAFTILRGESYHHG